MEDIKGIIGIVILLVVAYSCIGMAIRECDDIRSTRGFRTTFPCTGCGACCKRIDHAIASVQFVDRDNALYFPYKWDEHGTCEKLGLDNKCTIYDKRPLICKIDKLGEFWGREKTDWYKDNASACNKLQRQDKISREYRVKL